MLITLSTPVLASFNTYDFEDDIQAQRFQQLIETLRCPKCQNNNLADSNAPLASDIKTYVHGAIQQGQSDEEITDFLISRYGLFIIYDPKIMWLWLIPVLITAAGLLLFIFTRRKKTNTEALPDMETLIAEYEADKRRGKS